MKYIIYLRVSTDQQAESGLGLEAQRESCYRYINNKDAMVLEFTDAGYSGALSMDKRPALMNALNELEENDVLLVAKRDRLGRDVFVNAMIESAVLRKKARLVSSGGDMSGDNDPSSILMRRMIDVFAEYERLIIGARTKAAMQVKKGRNERVGRVPYGFRLCEDKIHLEKDEYEQSVLDIIRESRGRGETFQYIADKLNGSKMFNRGNTSWLRMAIYRVMK